VGGVRRPADVELARQAAGVDPCLRRIPHHRIRSINPGCKEAWAENVSRCPRANAEADATLLEDIAAPDAEGRKLLTDAGERMRLTACCASRAPRPTSKAPRRAGVVKVVDLTGAHRPVPAKRQAPPRIAVSARREAL
jgi:hypothetical protein